MSIYDDKEKRFQEYLNEKSESIVKTYSPVADEASYTNDNLKLPIDQRSIDNEPITPYTWKWIDLEKEENGEKVVAKLRRPNWWILANKADKIGNVVFLTLTEQGISGGFTVKGIRISQIDTRLMKPKREGDYTYRPLTGWFEHETSNVWNYTFSNGETIGATPNHPFFSERRKDYIPIGEIAIGKAIRNPQNEVITLTSKTPRTNGTEKVYIYRDHNFLVGNGELLVHNSCLPKISVIAPDWVTKGAHIHFDDIELAVRPDGRGGVIFQKVFSSTPDRDFDEAVKLAKEALNDPKWRLKFITQVEAGRTYMGTVTGALETLAKGRVAELSFLISALKKIK